MSISTVNLRPDPKDYSINNTSIQEQKINNEQEEIETVSPNEILAAMDIIAQCKKAGINITDLQALAKSANENNEPGYAD